jgi:hypothetical protein
MRLVEWMSGWVGVVAVTATASAATGLLVHVERTTGSIHDRTSSIAVSSRGIGEGAGARAALERTNELSASIAAALLPLTGPTGKIDERSARIAELLAGIRKSTASIAESSSSIEGSAGTIRSGLAAIDSGTAALVSQLGGLNVDASRILADLSRIRRGVALINSQLPATAKVLDGILAEGRDILTTLGTTERLTGCIDRGLNGSGSCRGRGR